MVWKKWEELPENMQTDAVKEYYSILASRRAELILKRIFDFLAALVLQVLLFIPMVVIALLIAFDSPGGVFYRQERVTTYGRTFRIHKFRTMVKNADRIGSEITVSSDSRITKIGAKLRKNRLDELPQLLDVLKGDMSFVGTRPEVPKYVGKYTDEMMATLLLPAGITSEASIRFKGEAKLLKDVEDVDRIYVEEILPRKMVYNLESVRNFRFFGEISTMLRTILAVLGKDYADKAEEPMKAEVI
ncbi:MAG: sugar transferase [Clostridia bacterium]|nr:sugar transferase [Clostridia bacterium]